MPPIARASIISALAYPSPNENYRCLRHRNLSAKTEIIEVEKWRKADDVIWRRPVRVNTGD